MPHTIPADLPDFPVERINAAHRQTMIITGAIGATILVYALVVEMLRRTMPAPVAPTGIDLVRIMLYVFVGIAVLGAAVVKGVLLGKVPVTGEGRLARLRTAAIVSAAFAEMLAIIGLALFMQSHRRGDFYVLLVVAAYMLARHFPLRSSWESYVRRGNRPR
jgi:F0F1-type ATP synthase membrane subunit c/vacuolar-type H+-ATPase subunit K